jgi:hypothetical protein
MSVSYDSNYGIGYKLERIKEPCSEEIESFVEYIECFLFGNGSDAYKLFEVFEVGEGSYTLDVNDIYIVIKRDYSSGFELLEKDKEALDLFIDQNKIKTIGCFGLFGGLLVH